MRNRYFITLPTEKNTVCDSLLQQLRAPDKIQKIVPQLSGFNLTEVGAAEDDGRIAYKLYFTVKAGLYPRGPIPDANSIQILSIGWEPSTGRTAVKEYQHLLIHENSSIRQRVADCLSAGASDRHTLLRKTVLEESWKILELHGFLHFGFFEIRQKDNLRFSCSFRIGRPNSPVKLHELASSLRIIARSLAIPDEDTESWLNACADDNCHNLAVGVDAQSRPFITVYHGALAQAPDYIEANSRRGILASSLARQPNAPQQVYAIGSINFELPLFDSRRAKLDRLRADPDYTYAQLAEFLVQEGIGPDALTWIFEQNGVPLYIVRPAVGFGTEGYARLMEFYRARLEEDAGWITMPGVIVGFASGPSGLNLPVITPELHGISILKRNEMILRTLGAPPVTGLLRSAHEQKRALVNHFIDTILHKLQNPGQSSHDHAINFAAAQAPQIKKAFDRAQSEGLVLQTVTATPAPLAPPRSDYWEVSLVYRSSHFRERLRTAARVFVFRVDVAPIVPVLIGEFRELYQ